MTTILTNARLATMSPDRPGLGVIENCRVVIEGGRIVAVGETNEIAIPSGADVIDCEGRWVTPGLIDCHTHLVHAGNRAREFEMRLAGASYEEIARAGGGIVSTVKQTREAVPAEGWHEQGSDAGLVAGGLAEGFETIAVFVAMCLLPESFAMIAYGFAALCALTTVIRWRQAWVAFAEASR